MKLRNTLGQHWLFDESSLQAMIDSGNISLDDVVLEIGPGLGSLTEKLLAGVKCVVAVELDPVLAESLIKRNASGSLEIVQEDILKFDLGRLPKGYKVVANIPYYLTSNLIRKLSESTNPPASAALLVQKEVAERVAAKPGDMSLLSVTAQYFWVVSLGRVVKAELFDPPPKVDSQILLLKRKPELPNKTDSKKLFRLVRAGFSSRRKTLQNSLSGGLRISKQETGELLEKAGIDPKTRPQSLSLPQWHDLYDTAISMKLF